jgi:spore maturation protein CgeB
LVNMQIVLFCHSILSDWNHGNAHFLRGVSTELIRRGHDVRIFEPRDAWSLENLLAEYGDAPIRGFHAAYPKLRSTQYDPNTLDLDVALDRADMVIVHEWNTHLLVKRIGEHRWRAGRYALLFHDTHHRLVSSPESMKAYDLSNYDGVLAFGESLRQRYLQLRLARRVWTWHEAADTRVFKPAMGDYEGDVVWIGNWGDEERTAGIREFFLDPAQQLGLKASAYGVRYPDAALEALKAAGVDYRGWLPNYRAPEVYAKFRFTAHLPRAPYVAALPGIPTIRVFEALACGIPLICAPWDDCENLFTPGEDYLVARNGEEMKRCMTALMQDPQLARDLAVHGRRTILERHTCSHRVDQLLDIYHELNAGQARLAAAADRSHNPEWTV